MKCKIQMTGFDLSISIKIPSIHNNHSKNNKQKYIVNLKINELILSWTRQHLFPEAMKYLL